jgi:hypothetical protein
MARRGDGIYRRGNTWWLDFLHEGRRHYVRLGKGINRTAAGEIARVKRAGILKGEAGIGGPKKKDMVERYAHLSPNHKAEAIERLARPNSTTLSTTAPKVLARIGTAE